MSVLIVPAVFLLARELLRSDLGGLVAALAYALAPSSYVWMIQGGGVTRSPGMLLAVLALWQTVILVRQPTRGRAVGVGLLAGLTALVHPGAAVFPAISAVLIWLFEGRTRQALVHAAAAVGVALVVVAPWLIIVVSRHGLAALADVPSNGPDLGFGLLTILSARFTGLPFFDPLAVVGLVMAVVCLVQRSGCFRSGSSSPPSCHRSTRWSRSACSSAPGSWPWMRAGAKARRSVERVRSAGSRVRVGRGRRVLLFEGPFPRPPSSTPALPSTP